MVEERVRLSEMHYQESPHKCGASIEVQICVRVYADMLFVCVPVWVCTRYRRLSSSAVILDE